MSLEDATAKAAHDFATTLSQGVATAGHSLSFITDGATGTPIGRLWLGERPPVLFVYAVWLDEAVRGRGLGRQAMLLVEQEARRRGLARIELNVFAGNERARRLYRSLGYGEVAVYMSKPLMTAQ
jgi:ribosomal protein S18 acetylase RimI-like enzyme